jgi:L-ascorbate metabolism protein UlaG (beta-lactamase superfamily)
VQAEQAPSETRITYVGHGTVLIEMDGVRILTDPALKRWTGGLRRYGPLPDPSTHHHLDAVLISHLHLDHLDTPSLKMLPKSAVVIGPPLVGRSVHKVGFKTVIETRRDTTLLVGEVQVMAVHAEHTRRRWVVTPATEPLGFIIQGSSTIYFAGDTALFDEMDQIHDRIDVALLPIETWGVRPPEGRHMSPRSAASSLMMLEPRIAVPIHWGTLYFPGSAYTGKEATYAWFRKTRRRPEAFAAMAAEVAPDVEVRLLDPGEALVVPSHRHGPAGLRSAAPPVTGEPDGRAPGPATEPEAPDPGATSDGAHS